MQYTDLLFLFVFLPSLLAAYYICNPKYRNIILIMFSLVFYSCGAPRYMGLLYISLVIDAGLGCLIVKAKAIKRARGVVRFLLGVGIVYNLGILVYYKYFNFIVANTNNFFGTDFSARDILLPMGLSFYSFRAISYLVDSYSGKISKADPVVAVTYLSFFGQIQSGPIARYDTFCVLQKKTYPCFSDGVVRFMIGFSKKVLIADVLNNITTEVFDSTTAPGFSLAWLGAICYSLQLYYDFSGYSDMAIGICNMLGYDCPKNFDHPYMTGSIAEFWRRWHITLGAWFRDYVYIPLGGSRVNKPRLYFNLFVVWILTGIWHGAGWNFIVWGLGYFILISIEQTWGWPEKIKNKLLRNFYRVFVLLIINFQWVLFRSADLQQGVDFIKSMCNIEFGGVMTRAVFLLRDYLAFIILALIFVFPISEILEKLSEKRKCSNAIYHIFYFFVVTGGFIIALSFVVSGQNNPFLYIGF